MRELVLSKIVAFQNMVWNGNPTSKEFNGLHADIQHYRDMSDDALLMAFYDLHQNHTVYERVAYKRAETKKHSTGKSEFFRDWLANEGDSVKVRLVPLFGSGDPVLYAFPEGSDKMYRFYRNDRTFQDLQGNMFSEGEISKALRKAGMDGSPLEQIHNFIVSATRKKAGQYFTIEWKVDSVSKIFDTYDGEATPAYIELIERIEKAEEKHTKEYL